MNAQLGVNEDAVSTLANRQRGMSKMQGCSGKYEGKVGEGRRVNKQEEDHMVLHHMELAQEEAAWLGAPKTSRGL